MKKAHQRRVWVALLVRRLMMPAVNARPTRRASLQSGGAHPGENAPQPATTPESTVCQKPVIADTDGKSGAEVKTEKKREINRARPNPEAEQAADVQADNQKALNPVEAWFVQGCDLRQASTNHLQLFQIMFAELCL